MATMHFLRVLGTFAVMIALGLAGIYLVNMYGVDAPQANVTESCSGTAC